MLLDTLGRVDRRMLMMRGFRSYQVPTQGGSVHMLDGQGKGDLPPILVLHGICSRATNYRRVLPALLQRSRRVIAPDLPAHGFSSAPSPVNATSLIDGVIEALEQVLDEPVVLFGNSMGGAGAVKLAARHPDKVRGVILNSPGGAQVPEEDLQRFLNTFRMKNNEDAARFVGQIFLHPPWFRRVIAPGVRSMFQAEPIQELLSNLSTADLITAEELEKLTMPLLLLWGRGDRLMPLEHYRWYASAVPDHAVIEDPEELGHCPYQDRPQLLTDRILRFAEELR